MSAYRKKWLPHETDTFEAFTQALFLEKDYWKNMSIAVTNGIGQAFKK